MSLGRKVGSNSAHLSFSISRCYADAVLNRRMNRIRNGALERDGSRQVERAQSCDLKSKDRMS